MNKNVHLLIGNDFFLLELEIAKILKKQKIAFSRKNKSFWDLEEKSQRNQLMIDLSTPYFFESKIFLIKINDWKEIKEDEQRALVQTLKITKHHVFLCYQTEKNKYPDFKIFQNWTELHLITQLNKSKKLKLIKQKFEEEKVVFEPEVLEWLIAHFPNNMRMINNELDKIIGDFWNQQKIITVSRLKMLLINYQHNNIFPLVDAILTNDKKNIAFTYQNIQKQKISSTYLLSILETYLFYLQKIFLLKKQGKTLNEMMKIIPKKNFFVMNLEKISRKTSPENLQVLINKMKKLEYNTKLSKLTEKILLESFLI